MIQISILENWQMWWTVTIPPSCDICIQWARLKKSGIWVPHALSQNQKNQQVAICVSLLACHLLTCKQHRPFLSCIVIGDKKWCLYANIKKIRNGWARTREEYVGNVPISPLGTPFSSVHGSTIYLQMTKFQYVNSRTTIELQ